MREKNICSGYASYENGIFTMIKAHTCAPSPAAMKAKIAIVNLKQNARQLLGSTREIVDNTFQGLDNGNYLHFFSF